MVERNDSNVGVFARVWRVLLSAVLLLTTVVVGTTVTPAAAAGAATITKVLDPIQGAGYTAPNTFQTGANVRYRLTFQCSSLSTPCVTGTITDVLDPNLDFVQVIPPSSTAVTVTSSWDEPSRTVTVNLTSFDDGDSGEIVIVARVKGSTPGGTVIPNSGSITVPDGPIVTTPAVNIQVPGPTPSWGIIKNKTAPSADPTVGADVTYRIDITAPSPLGNVDISGGTVVDTYPAGATVVFSDGGVVDTVNHTITWTFGPIPANSLNCTLSPCRVGFKNIVLNYPAPSFVAGQTVTNYVQGNYDFANNTSGVANAQADVVLASATPVARFDKQGPVEIAPGAPILWTPVLVNQGNVVLHNVEIIDTLPTNVTNFQLAQFDYRYFISPGNEPVVFDVFVGGVWQSLATYVASNGSAGFPAPLPAGATLMRARVATLEPGVEIRIGLSGTASSVVGDTILNCATRTADEFTDTADACLTTTVVENFAKLQVVKQLKFVDPAATSAKPGDEFDWLLEVANKGGVPVTQIDIIDDLPPQFELLYTSCLGWAPDWPGLGTSYYLNAFTTCPSTPSAGAVTLVSTTPNVNANGDTRYHWRIDMTKGVLNPNFFNAVYTSLAAGGSVYLGIRVRVKPGTAVAQYTNNLQANTPDAATICEANGGPDTTDVDGDGNITEIMCAASSNVIIDEAAVVGAEKWDDGYPGLDHVDQSTGQPSAVCPDWGGYTRYPCVAQTVPNGPFDYKWKLQNYGNINLTNYVVYDVLPSVGDTGVSQLLGGQSRGTEWQPNLTGPVMIESQPAGANALVEYNLTFNPCRPELNQGAADGPWQGSCDNVWYTAAQISDWSTVHSFRVKAFQETNGVWPAWLPAEEIILSAPMVAPSTAIPSTSTPLNLSIAWNSVAHRAFRLNADQSIVRLLAAEPRKVGIIIPFTENLPDLVRLGNQVWLDTGAAAGHTDNGVYDTDETPISGVKLELWKDDGDGVFEPGAGDTLVTSTTTDADGNYWFIVDADTPYFVAIPTGQTSLAAMTSSTGANTGDTDNDDNGTPAPGYLAVSDVRSVALNGAPQGETDTNDAGSAETEADANITAMQDNDSDLTIDFGFVLPSVMTFRLGNLVWLDWNNNGVAEAGEAGVNGITVQLLDSVGAVIGSTVTAGGGKYLFSDLPAGDYSVRIPSGQVLLDGLWSSSNGEEADPDSNGDNNDNGTIVNASGVTSGVITLGPTANEPTNETLRSDVSTDDDNDAFPDNQSNYSVDFGFTAVRLGNQVWLDNGAGANFDNGKYDTDETPISGVDVELWADDGDGIFEPGTGDTLVKSTTTDADGNYWFLAQPNTAYFVAIAAGQPELATLVSSTGVNGGVIDNDDNGAPQATYASVSSVRSVSPGGAPTGEIDTNDGATTAESEANTNTRFLPDANSDLTIDFGFLPTLYDLALIKTLVTASPVQPGGNVEWTITVQNQGQTPSGDYTVTDTLPGGMSFVSADNGGIEAGGVVSWDLSGLAPGESKALKLVSKVDDVTKAPFRNWAEISSDSGADDDSTPDTNTGSDTGSGTGTAPNDQVTNHNDTTFDSNAETPLPNSATDEDDNDFEDVDVVVDYDLALAKVTSASNVAVGANVSWTIRVQNQGNVASGVYSITDRIPGGMSFVSCTGATACSDAAGVVTYTMPNLAVGQFVDVTLVTKVDDMNKQPFRNWAEISADSGADDDSTPDINTGTDTGYGPAMGATDNGGANDLYVGITDLNSLATDGPTTGFIDEDDQDDAIVSGAVQYDMALIKTVNTPSVVRGGEVTWTITVKNQGNVDSGAYSVTDTIPGGMSYVSSSPLGSHAAGIVTWTNLANLKPGSTTTLTVTTKADDLSKRPFRNWAEISADGADAYDLPGLNVEDEDSVPDTNTGSDNGAGIGTAPNDLVVNHNDISIDQPVGDEDDNDYEEVGVTIAYDLALVKVVDNASPVHPGDTITWRIRVKNQGNVSSGVYTITDRVPTGLTYGTCTGGAACSQAAGVVTFTMPSIAPGATADVTYTTAIADVTKAPFRNWAEISSDSAQDLYGIDDEDSIPNTNTGKDATLPDDRYVSITDLADVNIDQVGGDEDDNDDSVVNVKITYDLALVKILPAGQTFKQDASITFNILVKNQGNVNSGAYSVQDVIPAGLTFVSASDNPLNAGQTVSWDLPNLAPGEIKTLTLVVKIADVTKSSYINFAEITSDGSGQYGPGVHDEDSTPDGDITNDLLVDTDDVNIDSIPGDEDDHDRAVLDLTQVTSESPIGVPVPISDSQPLPATGSDPLQLVLGGVGLLGIGLLAVATTRRRRVA